MGDWRCVSCLTITPDEDCCFTSDISGGGIGSSDFVYKRVRERFTFFLSFFISSQCKLPSYLCGIVVDNCSRTSDKRHRHWDPVSLAGLYRQFSVVQQRFHDGSTGSQTRYFSPIVESVTKRMNESVRCLLLSAFIVMIVDNSAKVSSQNNPQQKSITKIKTNFKSKYEMFFDFSTTPCKMYMQVDGIVFQFIFSISVETMAQKI